MPARTCYFDKVSHTEGQALAEAERLNRSDRRRRKVEAFLCQNCGAWHVGSASSRPEYFLQRLASINAKAG